MGFLDAPQIFIERIYILPLSPTFPTRSWNKRASTEKLFCVWYRLTSFAAQITALMYVASIRDNYDEYCINIVIHYASTYFSVSTSCATHLSDSIRTFTALLCSPFSAMLSPIHDYWYNLLCYVWSDLVASIHFVCPDSTHLDMFTMIWSDSILSGPIQYYMITYLWYNHSSLLWSSLLCSLQPNPRSSLIWSLHSDPWNF